MDCIQNSGNHEAVWTEAETLLLLESVLKHGDDWDLVAENVKTKTKADCISKLIQLPFGDLMLGSSHRSGGLVENDGNLSIVKQGQVASSESNSEENVKREDQCEDVKNESNQNGDAENQVPPLKRKRTTPPSDTGNSLMQQVKEFFHSVCSSKICRMVYEIVKFIFLQTCILSGFTDDAEES